MASRKKKGQEKPLDQNLQVTLSKIVTTYGDGSIMRLGSRGHIEVPSIPTNALALDIDLGIGGFPRGRMVEVYGPESSGKTTLCLTVVANAQKAGGVGCIIDTEHALDPTWAATIGCNVDDLLISQPDCAEDALGIALDLVQSNQIAILVIDSVAALVPRAEIEGQIGDSHVGLQARLMSQAMRKLNGAVCKSNTCLVFTNQIREKIGVMFGNPETTSGGNALKFYASIRMRISKSETITATGDEHPIGNVVKYNIVKNKMAAPFRKGTFDILYDSGINPAYSLVDVAEEFGVVEKRGSWYAYGTEQLGQGKSAVVQLLLDDPDLMKKIDREVRIAAGLIKEKLEEPKPEEPKPEGAPGDESK